MAYGACDTCGNAYEEYSCTKGTCNRLGDDTGEEESGVPEHTTGGEAKQSAQ